MNDTDYVAVSIPNRGLSGTEKLRENIGDDSSIHVLTDNLYVFATHGDDNHHMQNVDIVEVGIDLPDGTGIIANAACTYGTVEIYDVLLTIVDSFTDASALEAWLTDEWIPNVFQNPVESLLQAYPTFTDDYGFTEYFDALKVEQGGLFRSWSVQSKAQLSEMLPTLCQMEVDRMKTFYPEFLTDLSLLSSLMRQRYGSPDDTAISENDAIRLSQEWMQSHAESGKDAIDQFTIYTAYLIDGTAQWAVSFYDKGCLIAETRMDAHSGVFSQIDRVMAEQIVFAQSEALGAPSAISLRDLYARAIYDFESQMWTFNYYTDPFDAGVNYHVEEVQMVAIPGSNG